MWLSEQVRRKAASGASAGVGGVTISGENAAVMLTGEYRGLKVLTPEGFFWRPGAGTQVMVLTTDDGERFILGAADETDAPSLAEGELCLKSGSGWLKLGADGVISAEGEIHVNGDVHLTGDVYVNGDIHMTGGAHMNGSVNMSGSAEMNGDVSVNGSLLVNGKNVKVVD